MNYPQGWPTCACGDPVLDGHLTCGRVECDESGARATRQSSWTEEDHRRALEQPEDLDE